MEKTLLLRVLPHDNWNGAYITLGHRWAIPQPAKLRRKNEAEPRSAGIGIASLPRIFQDSIQIMRWLEVQYLWIDSLCIFQDSIEDREREAGIMGAIYGGGLFGVAATDADGVYQCGFPGRLARPGNDTLLPVVCSRDNALLQGLRDNEIIPGGDWPEASVIRPRAAFNHQVFQSTLLGRGRLHQEVLLAPATLFVSRKQAWWHPQLARAARRT